MCSHGRAHWRHLANTIELSVCGGDAVLCQITLTTCFCRPFLKAGMLSLCWCRTYRLIRNKWSSRRRHWRFSRSFTICSAWLWVKAKSSK